MHACIVYMYYLVGCHFVEILYVAISSSSSPSIFDQFVTWRECEYNPILYCVVIFYGLMFVFIHIY